MAEYGFPLGVRLLFIISVLALSSGSGDAKMYAIERELGALGRSVAIHLQIRVPKELECVGAYLEDLTPRQGERKREQFHNSSYSIVFGVERCGSRDKIHCVLKSKNVTSGEYSEHHLKSPPTIPSENISHVYTAILKPNSDLLILIDGEQMKRANFMNPEEFDPPCILPHGGKRAKLPDLEAVKPEVYPSMPKVREPKSLPYERARS